MLKPQSLALTPPGHRGSSREQGGIRNNSSSPAGQNKGQLLNTSELGEKNTSRWQLHGLKPTWKSIQKTCGNLSEREGVVLSPYCKLNIGEFQTWVSGFPDTEHGEGGGPYTLLWNFFGWYPPCYVGCNRSGFSREMCKGFHVSTTTCVLSFLDLPGFFWLCSHSAAKPQAGRRLQWGKPKLVPKYIYDTSPVLFGITKWTDLLASVLLNHFTAFEKSHPSHKSTSWQRSCCQAVCTKQKSKQI